MPNARTSAIEFTLLLALLRSQGPETMFSEVKTQSNWRSRLFQIWKRNLSKDCHFWPPFAKLITLSADQSVNA